MRGLYRPFGRTLLLETDSAAVLALAEETFGRFGAAERGAPDLTLRLAAPSGLGDPASFRSEVLLFELLSRLGQHGLMGVHGSAVVRNGRAALLRGPSGAGKTTLAYAAARSRFQALAEDVVWIDLAARRWRGLPWFFHLLPDARRLFPELGGFEPVLERAGKMKLEIDLDAVWPGSAVPEAEPGPVVLLERAARTGLAPLAPGAALEAWRLCPAGTEESFPGYRRRVEELLAGGAWRLRLGTGPAALDAALELLETLLP